METRKSQLRPHCGTARLECCYWSCSPHCCNSWTSSCHHTPPQMNSSPPVWSHFFVVSFGIVLLMLFSPWHVIFLSSFKAPLLLYFIALLFFPFSSHPHSHSTAHLSELLECISCIYTSKPSSICLFRYMHTHENRQYCLTIT